MVRRNGNALTGGNAPRRSSAPTRTFRQAWQDTVSAVAGSAWETSAQVAAQLADGAGITQRTERWYETALDKYRALTAPAHLSR